MMSCPSKAQPLAILKSNPSELLSDKVLGRGPIRSIPSCNKIYLIVSEIFFLVNFVGEINKCLQIMRIQKVSITPSHFNSFI